MLLEAATFCYPVHNGIQSAFHHHPTHHQWASPKARRGCCGLGLEVPGNRKALGDGYARERNGMSTHFELEMAPLGMMVFLPKSLPCASRSTPQSELDISLLAMGCIGNIIEHQITSLYFRVVGVVSILHGPQEIRNKHNASSC